jgi:hypothetical protein
VRERSIVVIERAPGGGSLSVEAGSVHAHACPAWRMGRRHGPCKCGASALWEKHRRRIVLYVSEAPVALAGAAKDPADA